MLRWQIAIALAVGLIAAAPVPLPIQKPSSSTALASPEPITGTDIQSGRNEPNGGNSASNNQPSAPPAAARPKAVNAPTQKPDGQYPAQDKIEGYTAEIAVFTKLLFWATGLLGIIAGINLWAFIRAERAHIALYGLGFVPPVLAYDTPIWVEYVAKNGGKSAALLTDLAIQITGTDQELPKVPSYRVRNPHLRGALLPDIELRGTFDIKQDGKPFLIPKSQEPLVLNETIKVYAYGYVEYTDPFSVFKRRKTGFCFKYNPRKGGFEYYAPEGYSYIK